MESIVADRTKYATRPQLYTQFSRGSVGFMRFRQEIRDFSQKVGGDLGLRLFHEFERLSGQSVFLYSSGFQSDSESGELNTMVGCLFPNTVFTESGRVHLQFYAGEAVVNRTRIGPEASIRIYGEKSDLRSARHMSDLLITSLLNKRPIVFKNAKVDRESEYGQWLDELEKEICANMPQDLVWATTREGSEDLTGPTIREWRKVRGLSQSQLARLTGMSSRYFSLLETGTIKQGSDEMLEKVSEVFQIPVSDLLSGRLPLPIGEVVRIWRESKGLTQKVVAQLGHIKSGQVYISMLERGERRRPREKHLQAIAEGMGIPPEYLIYRLLPSEERNTPEFRPMDNSSIPNLQKEE